MAAPRLLKFDANNLEGQTYQPRTSVRLSIVDTSQCVSALKMGESQGESSQMF